jgi:cyclophilin family peptidyl-prolyl cis-trans isomerase
LPAHQPHLDGDRESSSRVPGEAQAVLRSSLAALILVAGCATAQSGAVGSAADPPAPRLLLSTDAGEITIRLAPAAAPAAVERLVRLAREPLYRDEVVADPAAAREVGYFDGLGFDYAKPHVELRTASRAPAGLFEVAVEIDARALGLDGERLADYAAAMQALQEELIPAASRSSQTGGPSPGLAAWIEQWEATMRADFLVGVSRREVNEALGWRYRSGLASLPVVRGAVFLPSRSPEVATLALAIALADQPRRTGRETVVGHVESGLEVADKIALEPQLDPASRMYRPRHPVLIRSASILEGP